MTLIFKDRLEAGEKLAGLIRIPSKNDVVVVGLPRGGVLVAAPIARFFKAPLTVLLFGIRLKPVLFQKNRNQQTKPTPIALIVVVLNQVGKYVIIYLLGV